MARAEFKAPREGDDEGGEPRLDDDCFRCVLQTLGYSAELAMCACLNKRTFPVATNLMSEARKQAVDASRHTLPDVDEKVYNRFILQRTNEGSVVGTQKATWIVEEGQAGDTEIRVVRMSDCEEFVRRNFPVQTVAAFFDHLPLLRGEEARRSVLIASSACDVPEDLYSPDFKLIQIKVRMPTCDPGLHFFVSGVVETNVGVAIDEYLGQGLRSLGKVHCSASYVHWTGFRARIVA